MNKTLACLILGILALGCIQGCAGVMEFNTPKEFQGQKVKEDPPGTYLPLKLRAVKVQAC